MSINKKDKHFLQGKENEKLAKSLRDLGCGYKDWIITICFYSSLHYVLSRIPESKNPKTHKETESLVFKYFGKKTYQKYRFLSEKSRNSRYYPEYASHYRRREKDVERCFDKLLSIKTELNIS
jgi:nicotinamide mononucleotide adenylyltransferase